MPVSPHTTTSPRSTGTAAKLPTGRPRTPAYWELSSSQAKDVFQSGQTGGGQTIDLTAIADKQTEQQRKGEEQIAQFIKQARAEREQIRSQVMQERSQMLSAIGQQAGQVRRDVDVLVQGRLAQERTGATEAMRNYQEQMASLGHPVSPGTQLQMSRKLAAGGASRVSQFAAQQRQIAHSREVELLRMRGDIYASTQRETPSEAEIMGVAQQMGAAAGAAGGRSRIGGRSRTLGRGSRAGRPSRVLSRQRGIPSPAEEFMARRTASGYTGPGATPRGGTTSRGGTPSPYIGADEFDESEFDQYRTEPRFTVYPGGGG